eukprot:scaffold7349_cov173-Amphora_coffeaeformis.AAC.112
MTKDVASPARLLPWYEKEPPPSGWSVKVVDGTCKAMAHPVKSDARDGIWLSSRRGAFVGLCGFLDYCWRETQDVRTVIRKYLTPERAHSQSYS